jgi:hypothetical protein
MKPKSSDYGCASIAVRQVGRLVGCEELATGVNRDFVDDFAVVLDDGEALVFAA